MGIKPLSGFASKQGGNCRRNLGIGSSGTDLEPHALARPYRIDGQRPAARNGLAGNDQHIEQQFNSIFCQKCPRQVPGKLGLFILKKTSRDTLCVAKINLSTGGAGRSERNTAKLQFCRRLARAAFYEIERKLLSCFVLFLFEDLQPVDYGAHRTDEVMTDP